MSALMKRLAPSDRKALVVLSVIVMLPVVVVALAGTAQALVAAIITTAGWATIPVWAAWAIIGTDSVGLVIAILAAVGIYNPPMWVVWLLIAAASVSL